MADGLFNIAGRPAQVHEFAGMELSFRAITLAEHAEKEAYIASLRPDPLAALERVSAKAAPSVRRSIEDAVLRAVSAPLFVSRETEQEFDQSVHGVAWGLWRALRDDNGEFGQLSPGETATYTSPAGVGYSVGPRDGVQLAMDLMEAVGNAEIGRLIAARDGAEQRAIVGN